MSTNRGFTLLELLIAMTILIMLIGTATWSHRFFTNQWERLSRRNDNIAKQLISLQQLSVPLASTSSYSELWKNRKLGYVWRGTRTQFAGITSFSLFQTGQDSIYKVEFFNTDSGCVLNYQESKLANTDVSFDKILNMSMDHSLSIPFSNPCRSFEYFGWKPLRSPEESENGVLHDIKKASWLPNYDGVQSESTPLGVKLRFETLDNRYFVLALPNTLFETITYSGESLE